MGDDIDKQAERVRCNQCHMWGTGDGDCGNCGSDDVSRWCLTDERDEANAEVERLRHALAEKTHAYGNFMGQAKDERDHHRETLRGLLDGSASYVLVGHIRAWLRDREPWLFEESGK